MGWLTKDKPVEKIESKEYKELTNDIVTLTKKFEFIDGRMNKLEDQLKSLRGKLYKDGVNEDKKEPEKEESLYSGLNSVFPV